MRVRIARAAVAYCERHGVSAISHTDGATLDRISAAAGMRGLLASQRRKGVLDALERSAEFRKVLLPRRRGVTERRFELIPPEARALLL